MGMIFPLSTGGRIVLILIALVLAMICWMLWRPEFWKKIFRKGAGIEDQLIQPNETAGTNGKKGEKKR